LNLRDVCGKINYIFQHDRRTLLMAVQYNKLWKLLVDKKMSKADLRKQADISSNTMTKLRRDVSIPHRI
jgi:hypothetical protein